MYTKKYPPKTSKAIEASRSEGLIRISAHQAGRSKNPWRSGAWRHIRGGIRAKISFWFCSWFQPASI